MDRLDLLNRRGVACGPRRLRIGCPDSDFECEWSARMKVAVVKETSPGELRVALVPLGVKSLLKAGLEVVVESDAGVAAGVTDADYREAGATI
ncbi:MAG: hypothetical protein IIC35_06040, partial [Gemmatimonadetes bacterium]|nr:hypothetical protein [Gemmatimonadota bacterium]